MPIRKRPTRSNFHPSILSVERNRRERRNDRLWRIAGIVATTLLITGFWALLAYCLFHPDSITVRLP